MAFLAPQEDEQQNQQQEQGSFTNEKVLGGAAPGTSGGGQTTQQTQGKAPSKSGSFTNLQNYVTANQGQDKAMAGVVGGNVQGQANTAITDAKTTASDTYKAGEQGLATQEARATGVINNLNADPTKVSAEDFTAAQTWNMPQADWSAVNNKIDKVADYGERASSGNFSDLTQITKDTMGDSRYSQGESNLDAWIMGSGQEGRAALKDVDKIADSTLSTFGGVQTDLTRALSDLSTKSGLASDRVLDTATGLYGDAETRYNDLVTQAATQSAENKAALKTLIDNSSADGVITDKEAEKLGISTADANVVLSAGGDLSQFISGAGNITAGDLAEEGLYDRYTALAKLLGEKTGGLAKASGNLNKGPIVDMDALAAFIQNNPGPEPFSPEMINNTPAPAAGPSQIYVPGVDEPFKEPPKGTNRQPTLLEALVAQPSNPYDAPDSPKPKEKPKPKSKKGTGSVSKPTAYMSER